MDFEDFFTYWITATCEYCGDEASDDNQSDLSFVLSEDGWYVSDDYLFCSKECEDRFRESMAKLLSS